MAEGWCQRPSPSPNRRVGSSIELTSRTANSTGEAKVKRAISPGSVAALSEQQPSAAPQERAERQVSGSSVAGCSRGQWPLAMASLAEDSAVASCAIASESQPVIVQSPQYAALIGAMRKSRVRTPQSARFDISLILVEALPRRKGARMKGFYIVVATDSVPLLNPSRTH